jgi:UDP-N-acetylglucosamine acyltransferase
LTTLIHPTAVIAPGADLHPTVEVGPYAVIGEKVSVGPNTVIGAHVVLDGRTEIGARNQIFPGAAIGLESQDQKYDGSINLVKLGDDNIIREYVTINRATRAGEATEIGNHNLLMAYVHVAHNCVIEDHVIVSNAVSLAGHVWIEPYARVGGMTGVHQFVHIGRLAMVGAMSRIDRDVPPYMLVEGSPPRVRGINQVGVQRYGLPPEEEAATLAQLKQVFRQLYRSSLTFGEALAQLDDLEATPAVAHLRRFLQASSQADRRGTIPGKRPSTKDEG